MLDLVSCNFLAMRSRDALPRKKRKFLLWLLESIKQCAWTSSRTFALNFSWRLLGTIEGQGDAISKQWLYRSWRDYTALKKQVLCIRSNAPCSDSSDKPTSQSGDTSLSQCSSSNRFLGNEETDRPNKRKEVICSSQTCDVTMTKIVRNRKGQKNTQAQQSARRGKYK